jgi:uncharacterized membrane protein
MSTPQGTAPTKSQLATIAIVLAVAGLLLGFFVGGIGAILGVVAIALGVVVLVQAMKGRPGRRLAIAAIVVGVVALLVGVLHTSAGQDGFQRGYGDTVSSQG